MLTFLPPDWIQTSPDRQRKEIPDSYIKELSDSIEANGLIHAPTIGENNLLVAGECRLRAMKLLLSANKRFYYAGQVVPEGKIPAINTHLTTPRELFLIELEENIRRKNLTPVEQAQAIAKLHSTLKEENPLQTQGQTGAVVAGLRGKEPTQDNRIEIADSILIAQFAGDKDVQSAPSRKKAVKIAKRKLEAQALEALGALKSQAPELHEVHTADSLVWMTQAPTGLFDGIITDPPYGINADNFGSASFQGAAHTYDDTLDTALLCYGVLAREGFRICRDQAHLYAFLDIKKFASISNVFSDAGWEVWPTPLIWAKGSTAHAPRPDHGPKRGYEAILYAIKGKKRIQILGSDVLQVEAVSSGKLHPAQKPIDLISHLIRYSFIPGSHILDPFCGVGTTLLAAKSLAVTGTGVELDEGYAAIARARLADPLSELSDD